MADRYLCHPLGDYVQTSSYDYYTHNDHAGKVDMYCPTGTVVYSMTDGIVTQKFRDAGPDDYCFFLVQGTNNRGIFGRGKFSYWIQILQIQYSMLKWRSRNF